MEYHSPIKKNEIMASAAIWMQPEVIIRTEVSQKEKEKYCIISLTCGIYNMTQMNLHNRNRPINREDRFVVATGDGLAHGWRRRLGLADVSCNIQNG